MFPLSAVPCVSCTFCPLRTNANRLDPPYGGQSEPAINKLLAALTSACTELHLNMCCCWMGRAQREGWWWWASLLPPPSSPLSLCSLHSSRSLASSSPLSPPLPSSPPPESAVHLAPQIAYDSRAISSPGFELNWSEQYHLCLLKGRSGSRCCSAERNREGEGGEGERGAKKLLPATIKASVSHAICPAGSPVRRAGCLLLPRSLLPHLHPLSFLPLCSSPCVLSLSLSPQVCFFLSRALTSFASRISPPRLPDTCLSLSLSFSSSHFPEATPPCPRGRTVKEMRC